MSRYFTPQNVTAFTRALASGINVNLEGLDAALDAVQLDIDSGADILLRGDLISSDSAKGSALVRHGGETVKAVLDKLTNPSSLAAAAVLTGAESLALFDGTTLVNLTLGKLAYAVSDQRAQFKNATAASFGEIAAASNDRVLAMGVRSSTHASGELAYLSTVSAIPFAILTGGSERFRIAANGYVGIGAVNPNFKLDVNGTIRGAASVGAVTASNGSGSGQTSVILRREGAAANQKDWEILQGASGELLFRTVNDAYNDSQSVMQFNRGAGVAVDNIVFATGGNGRWQITNVGAFIPLTDAVNNMGSPSFRIGTYYGAVGAINTSDEREKTWRGGPSEAELRAARSIIAELGFYQWNDAIAEKGSDGARYHFGVRAQRAFAILEAEGLDWRKYAWCCYDQWECETRPIYATRKVMLTREVEYQSRLLGPDGNPVIRKRTEKYEEDESYDTGEVEVTLEAGDRYGVRPDQLCLFLIAALAG